MRDVSNIFDGRYADPLHENEKEKVEKEIEVIKPKDS